MTKHDFRFKVDLNVINHLGVGLYSSTPAALTELVANAWDADATVVTIDVNPEKRTIKITDDGHGMSPVDIQSKFLKVGYSRRLHSKQKHLSDSRKKRVMGRKGIGKLAMFALADRIFVGSQARGKEAVAFKIDVPKFKKVLEGSKQPEALEELEGALGLAAARPVRGREKPEGKKKTGSLLKRRKSKAAERALVFFGDLVGHTYAVDAFTGNLVWQKTIDGHPSATSTGTPALFRNTLYVSVSSYEEVPGSGAQYACCTSRGSLVALDSRTGAKGWRRYTIDAPATLRGKNSAGTDRFGPSGAPIWSSPLVDAARGQIYVTTGDNYSSQSSGLSDAVIAIDLRSGAIRWTRQVLARHRLQ